MRVCGAGRLDREHPARWRKGNVRSPSGGGCRASQVFYCRSQVAFSRFVPSVPLRGLGHSRPDSASRREADAV